MPPINLRVSTAVGVLQLIRDGAIYGGIGSVGVTEGELRLVTGQTPWVGTDRAAVVRTLETFLHGSLDVLGLPRIRIPAEYVAAAICTIVNACNIQTACAWMQREASASTEALVTAAEVGGDIEPVSAERLFALCQELYDLNERTEAADSFRHRMGMAVDQSQRKGQDG